MCPHKTYDGGSEWKKHVGPVENNHMRADRYGLGSLLVLLLSALSHMYVTHTRWSRHNTPASRVYVWNCTNILRNRFTSTQIPNRILWNTRHAIETEAPKTRAIYVNTLHTYKLLYIIRTAPHCTTRLVGVVIKPAVSWQRTASRAAHQIPIAYGNSAIAHGRYSNFKQK